MLSYGFPTSTLDVYAETLCTSIILGTCPSWSNYWTQIVSKQRLNAFPPCSVHLFHYWTRDPTTTVKATIDRIRMYFVDPFINYFYAPLLIVLSIFNMFVLREVLDNGSTIVYHIFEMFADLLMIIAPWVTDILQLNTLIGTCLFTPEYKLYMTALTQVFLTENPLTVLNSLLPVLSSFLLSIDRYRAVVHPIKWRTTHDRVSYALKLIFYTMLIVTIISILQWACVIGFAAAFAYIWPTYFSRVASYTRSLGSTWAHWSYANSLVPFFNQLITDIATIVICVFQTYALIVFMRSFSKKKLHQLDGDQVQRLKKMKTVRGLVVGTICSQTLVSFVFSVLSLGTVPSDIVYWFSTSDAAAKFGDAQLASVYLERSGTISSFTSYGRAFYRLCNMSTNLVTVFWHVLFCAQYRKGVIRVWRRFRGKITTHNQIVPSGSHAHTDAIGRKNTGHT
jgi:hypothetical protein